MEEDLRKARAEATAAAEAGQALLKSLAEVRGEKETALQQVHQLKLSLDSSQTMLENLQEEIVSLRSDHVKALKSKEDEILDMEKARFSLKDDLSQSVNELSEQVDLLTRESAQKDTTIKTLEEQLKDLKAKLEEESGKDEGDSNQLKSFEDQLEILREKLELMEREKVSMAETKCSLETDNRELVERVDSLNRDLAEARMTLSETEEELVGYQASMAQFKVEMGQMESKLNEGDAAQVEASRGNSLFSEVDDRRKVVEDKLKRQNDKMEEMRALSENKSKQLAKAQMQNLALLKKRPELGAGGVVGGSLLGGSATARHLEEMLMRERTKNTTLMQQIEKLEKNQRSSATYGVGPLMSRSTSATSEALEAQIKQTVMAEDMLVAANRSLAKLEKSEACLKSENARLKYELEGLKENKKSSKQPTATKTETLNFKQKDSFQSGGSLLSTKADTKVLTGKESTPNQDKVATTKQSSKAATAVSEKKARFAESVTTHEYVETESETKAKSRIVKSALNAEEEAEKVENECKQS